MKLLKYDVHNLSDDMYVQVKIYQFYHSFIYIANEGCHIRICVNFCFKYIHC